MHNGVEQGSIRVVDVLGQFVGFDPVVIPNQSNAKNEAWPMITGRHAFLHESLDLAFQLDHRQDAGAGAGSDVWNRGRAN